MNELYTGRLKDSAELYLVDKFIGDNMPYNETEDSLLSAAMFIVSNAPWGGYPPSVPPIFGGGNAPIDDQEGEDDDEEECL